MVSEQVIVERIAVAVGRTLDVAAVSKDLSSDLVEENGLPGTQPFVAALQFRHRDASNIERKCFTQKVRVR